MVRFVVRRFERRTGQISVQQLDFWINYSYKWVETKFGILGVKVWMRNTLAAGTRGKFLKAKENTRYWLAGGFKPVVAKPMRERRGQAPLIFGLPHGKVAALTASKSKKGRKAKPHKSK